MNDRDLKDLFEQTQTAPNQSAKERALAAALTAFDETIEANTGQTSTEQPEKEKSEGASQGSGNVHRLTANNNQVESKTMDKSTISKLVLNPRYSGMASAAVLILAVFLIYQPTKQGGLDLNDISSPTAPTIQQESASTKQQESSKTAPALVTTEAVKKEAFESRAVADSASPQIAIAPTSPQAELQLAPQSGASSYARLSPQIAQHIPEPSPPPSYQESGRDRFESTDPNPIKRVSQQPVSTFSIDVDTSSYSFVRRQLNQGVLPPKAAVRAEEMINYFPYSYPLPDSSNQPFSTSITVMDSPWKTGNKLVHIGIKGYELTGPTPKANLVFLLDVSGSMNSPDKLPLVKQSMNLLLSQLKPEDTVSIVVYAGAAGMVLEPTQVKEKQKILEAMKHLSAGGSTAGAAGIKLAYQLAESHFIKDGVNRIILATDGDFNVGINSTEELKGFVERKRESGVLLSVLGFGQGNYHDALMQALAQNGNGVAAYIDSLGEAQKILVDEATSTLFPIAKDVKIKVEFNPDTVSEYRLIGYETRQLAEEDFNNDAVDAGDIGAGHTVTAIYEITPVGSGSGVFSPSRYNESAKPSGKGSEYGFLSLRYKLPDESQSKLISQPIFVNSSASKQLLTEAQFATAVAGFAQLLKGEKYTGNWTYQQALELAHANKGEDLYGYRTELVQLIRKAKVADEM